MNWRDVDWTDPKCPISKHFTVHDAIWLPKWNRYADKDELSEGTQESLVHLFGKLDSVQEFLGVILMIHCALRPEKYNEEIGGAKQSAHMARVDMNKVRSLLAAVDFSAVLGQGSVNEDCDLIRALVQEKLELWGLRMENNPGGNWVHLDTKPVMPGRPRIFNV